MSSALSATSVKSVTSPGWTSRNPPEAKNISSSRLSNIEDADFALETARLTKAQIMSKAASSMLAQANASGEVFLRLIN
mgnify:CR=1 FL=1